MKDITVVEIGAEVTLHEDVPARVTAVAIRGQGQVQYEVTWWTNGERRTAWVEECEIKRTNPKRAVVGFGRALP